MPAQPTFLEQLAFRAGVAPAPVLDYIGALSLHAVIMGERLGLFAALRERNLPEEVIAAKLKAHPRGIRVLLDALASVGYIRKQNGGYALTNMAAKWMQQLSHGIGFFEWMAFEGWPCIEKTLQGLVGDSTSRPEHLDAAGQANRSAGMLSNSRLSADEIARRVRIARSARRMLDIGSGAGLYSARLCRKHPQLQATLVDTAPILHHAEQVMQEEGVASRASLHVGDFWKDPLGQGYDVTLLCNLLNAYSREHKIELLRLATATLLPNGRLVILDQMRRPTLRGAAKAVVELTNLRLFDPGQGDTYSLPDLKEWLPAAGLRVVQTGALQAVPWMCFLVARRAGGSRA
jgi:SAM-dependent methyltransferase